MVRTPAVAGQFYPAHPDSLRQTIAALLPAESPPQTAALAIVSPHAGYVYSGSVAAQTFSQVALPPTVIILGPNHHGAGARLAVGTDPWQMPFGEVPIADCLAETICRDSLFTADQLAHRREHSLEVQVPFLQYFQPQLSIVPICVSHLSYEECLRAAQTIAAAIKAYQKPVILIASTDMTHYESREIAAHKDALALACLKNLDPAGLYSTVLSNRITMCGIMPTTITLIAAKLLGAQAAKLVRYTDSGEVSGDTDQVVGYAGLVIS